MGIFLHNANPSLQINVNNMMNKYCLHQLFEQQTDLTPNNIAIKFRDISLTYLQLNESSNKLAAFLAFNYAIKPGQVIGIMLNRSEKMLIAILGILKAGGAYLPIDPDAPIEQNMFICSDAAVNIILNDNDGFDHSDFSGIDFVDLNKEYVFIGNGENCLCTVSPNNLAYVIFTSGSTGRPKGVLIEHRSVINFIEYNIDNYNITANDVILNMNSFLFDVSVWELFVPLLTGGTLAILETGDQKYPEKIINICSEMKVNMFFITPAMLQMFLSYLEANPEETSRLTALKRVFVGGETLTAKLANLFNKLLYRVLGVGLTNIYGPTETTVWVTDYNCESNTDLDLIPIGKAVSNTEIYIFNNEGQIVPDGEIGELVVGGIQVAKGYLNRVELDKEKFVKNLFKETGRIYKTGDMARFLPDGNIEFLGRMDNQVKLNGYRIELNGIESEILKNLNIKECTVLIRDINDTDEIVAYYTTINSVLTSEKIQDDLTQELKLHLPEYMVPSFFVRLLDFPINRNGKIDRINLPLPSQRHFQETFNYNPPSTFNEKAIALILTKHLQIDLIGIDDNFFTMGVKSLMVTKIIIEINDVLKCGLKLATFFQSPTVRQLANDIEQNHKVSSNPVAILRKGNDAPLFMLPGLHGDASLFINFSNTYKIPQLLYGISYRENCDYSKFESFYLYAKYLITQMKLVQPVGPYNLLGYSFGGSLAFEMAVQLQQMGEQVGLLIIISAETPRKYKFLSKQAITEIRFLLKPNLYLLKNYLKYRTPYLINKLIKRKVAVDDSLAIKDYFRLNKTHDLNFKYKGDILLIHEDILKVEKFINPRQSWDYTAFNMKKQWKKVIDGEVINHKIICSHEDFFSEEISIEVTDVIEKYVSTKNNFRY